MVKRSLAEAILRDLDEKIVVLSGPRQCGKTTLSRNLHSGAAQYLSYDSAEDRSLILKKAWDRRQELVVFDELHKMRNWKSWLKGVFDKEGPRPRLLVTGSARLAQFKKAGDSLAGRHFNFRLHPFDLKELARSSSASPHDALETMLQVGGFPEPFLKGEKSFYRRWRAGHLDLIIRHDLPDLGTTRDIRSVELLAELLAERVGSSVSAASLARDLERDPKTVASWMNALEDLYVIFRIPPWSKSISRAVRKEPKHYFFDVGAIVEDRGARFENLVACALLKETQRLRDVEGVKAGLHYAKFKGGKEIDFLVTIDDKPKWLIEAKVARADLSPSFRSFAKHFKGARRIQLVADLDRDRTAESGESILRAAPWLATLDLLATP